MPQQTPTLTPVTMTNGGGRGTATTDAPPSTAPFSFLSLFAGVGGFDLGLSLAGMRCVGQVEIDPRARGVLARHFPEVPRHDDVRTAAAWWTSAPRPRVDLVAGGFPCQDLSTAGRRAGLAGDRSGLFFDLAHVIAIVQPRWILLENVRGLLSSQEGRDFRTVLDTLEDLRYGVAWRVLDSQYFGVPQRRRRVFVAGRLGGPGPLDVLLEPRGGEDPPATPRAVGAGTARVAGDRAGADRERADGGRLSSDSGPRPPVFAIKPGARREHSLGIAVGGPAYCLTTAPTAMVSYSAPDPSRRPTWARRTVVRRFTPREYERLQGFPDGWTAVDVDGRRVADTTRYRMMGNAVTVDVVAWIGRRLMAEAASSRSEDPGTGLGAGGGV